MGHSKIPWTANPVTVDGAIARWHIAGAEHGSVFPICEHVFEDGPPVAEQIANAEFIVRACNSHYELLEACKNLLGNLRYTMDRNNACYCSLEGTCHHHKLIARVEAALKKAEQS